METFFEPIDLCQPLSGAEVIQDLAACVVGALQGKQGLLATDAYSSYSAKIEVTLQLHDIDTTAIEQSISIGEIDTAAPVETISVDVPVVDAATVRQRSGTSAPSLEKTDEQPAKRERFYAPRQRKL